MRGQRGYTPLLTSLKVQLHQKRAGTYLWHIQPVSLSAQSALATILAPNCDGDIGTWGGPSSCSLPRIDKHEACSKLIGYRPAKEDEATTRIRLLSSKITVDDFLHLPNAGRITAIRWGVSMRVHGCMRQKITLCNMGVQKVHSQSTVYSYT